jgi:SAM-dependent methyltransferase
METLDHLDAQRQVWDNKPVIRALYGHYHQLMASHCVPGKVVEIGAGCGNLKASNRSVVSMDIVNSNWVNLVGDAEQLPFADQCLDNIVMLDVLHHIRFPLRFLAEASRTLRPGGRLVILEPGITPISNIFYSALHPEPVDMSADLFSATPQSSQDPFDSNQAIPTLLFSRAMAATCAAVPQLTLTHQEWLGLASYPLSGGFRPWQLLTPRTLKWCLRLESYTPSWLKALSAFRLFTVLARTD